MAWSKPTATVQALQQNTNAIVNADSALLLGLPKEVLVHPLRRLLIPSSAIVPRLSRHYLR